jgi:xylulokinase
MDPGPVQLTIGSGGQLVTPLLSMMADPHGQTHCFRAAAPRRWYRMAAVQNVGLALEWVRAVLSVTWEDLYAEAFAVPAGAEGVTFLPHISGERTPYFDPHRSGAWMGLRSGHRRGHLLRAALEGVAFAVRQGIEALEAAGTPVPELRLAGGGSIDSRWRQLLADALDRQLIPVAVPAASARGAALLAGVATGIYGSALDTVAMSPARGDPVLPIGSAELLAAFARFKEIAESSRRLGPAL